MRNVAMMAAGLLGLLACSDGPDSTLDGNNGAGRDAGPVENACGPVVTSVGNECDTWYDCPGTPSVPNQVLARCDNCVPFAQVNICEAGRCRRIDVDNATKVEANVEGNFRTESSEGYVEILMSSITSDGRRVSCEELLSTCDWRDPRLNVFNSNGGRGRFLRNQLTEIFTDSAEGEDFIFMALITDSGQGRGNILTIGCVDDFDVTYGQVNVIPEAIVPLDEYPPAN